MTSALSQRVLNRYLTARRLPFNVRLIEKLRKDFLILLKNVPHVVKSLKDTGSSNYYGTYNEFREVVKQYRMAFKDIIFDKLIDRTLKQDVSDRDAEQISRAIFTSAWDLSFELGNLPERPISFRDVDTWAKRIRRKAPKFWKDAKRAIEWFEQKDPAGLSVGIPDRLVIQGFQTEIIGFQDTKYNYEYLEQLKAALKTYRQRAKAVMPWLIRHQLPLKLDFEGGLDVGGSYMKSYIWINATSGDRIPQRVKILAHEMGHHRYKYIGGSAEKFWYTAIRQDYGPLSIQKVLDVWPTGTKYSDDFVTTMATKDPILALQVDVLSFAHGGVEDFQYRSDFEDALADGQTTVIVPKTPVTGYAGKNPEEAFCEAVGLSVAYGPRAVHARIRHWLNIILPGEIKTARSQATTGVI